MMSLLTFKIIAALSTMTLSVISGLIPLRIAVCNKHLLHLGDAFAGGIFLSAALLHLLPDATKSYAALSPTGEYPLVQLICVITFLMLILLERGMAVYGEKKKFLAGTNGQNAIAPFLLIILLAVHSLIEGTAIGISTSITIASIIFFAVIVHKGSESLALACNMLRHGIKMSTITKLIILFSLVTPFGILGASIIQGVMQMHAVQVLGVVFNSIAAGTFLYLGSVHIMECEKSFEDLGEITALILGIAIMSIAAIWV